jgi:serine/threonine-protein kinase RsbW
MSGTTLTFPAEVAHIRTARLVAGAVAGQCDFDDSEVADIRLAVGEACAVAVAAAASVEVAFEVEPTGFTVRVSPAGGRPSGREPDPLALMLMESLADQFEDSVEGIRLRWYLG